MHQSVKVSMKRGRGEAFISFSASSIEYHFTFDVSAAGTFCAKEGNTDRNNIIKIKDLLILLLFFLFNLVQKYEIHMIIGLNYAVCHYHSTIGPEISLA
jgi:hypothetical protein